MTIVAMTLRAVIMKDLDTLLRIRGTVEQWQRCCRAPLQRARYALGQELNVGDHRLHLFAVMRKHAPIHTSLHAAIDALFKRAHRILARHVRRVRLKDTDHGVGVSLSAAI